MLEFFSRGVQHGAEYFVHRGKRIGDCRSIMGHSSDRISLNYSMDKDFKVKFRTTN